MSLNRSYELPIHILRCLCFLGIFNIHFWLFLDSAFGLTRHQTIIFKEPLSYYLEFTLRGSLFVDVFHILSSLLLTSKLLSSFSSHGRTGFSSFFGVFVHRVLRFMPTYFTLLLFVVAVAQVQAPLPSILTVLQQRGASGGDAHATQVDRQSLLSQLPFPLTEDALQRANQTRPAVPNVEDSWKSFLFINNYFSMRHQFLPHGWTIALEVQWAFVWLSVLYFALPRISQHRVSQFVSRDSDSDGKILHSSYWQIDLTGFLRLFVVLLILSIVFPLCAIVYMSSRGSLSGPIPSIGLPLPLSSIAEIPIEFTDYFQFLYLPLYSRMGGFLMGALLAFVIHVEAEHDRHATTSTDETQRQHQLLPFSFLRLFISLLVFSFFVPNFSRCALPPHPAPFSTWYTVCMLCLHRPIFAACVSVWLYWCLHAYRRRQVTLPLRSFFSLSNVISFFSALTYPAYLLHPMVLLAIFTDGNNDMFFRYLSLEQLKDTPITESELAALPGMAAQSLGITILLSAILDTFIERPGQAFMKKIEALLIGSDSHGKKKQ